MISADDVRGCRDGEGVLSLFRRLGYPIEPVEVDRAEWTRAGVDIPWAGTSPLHLAARLECLDVFFMEGQAHVSEVTTFLSSYAKYNVITKSVLINYDSETCNVFISALAGHNRLRRLADITAASASVSFQRTADHPRNPCQDFHSSQSRANADRNRLRQQRAGSGAKSRAVHDHFGELRIRQLNHRAANSGIADQQVRPAAEHKNRDVLLVAEDDDATQFIGIARRDKELSRAANIHPSERGQRAVRLCDFAECVV